MHLRFLSRSIARLGLLDGADRSVCVEMGHARGRMFSVGDLHGEHTKLQRKRGRYEGARVLDETMDHDSLSSHECLLSAGLSMAE